MKNHLLSALLFATLIISPIYADEAPGLTCGMAPYVGAEYSAHLTPGTYWFYSTSYDFPFSVEYVWDRTKMSYSKSSPEFVVDFSCETGVYEDETLYEVIKFAKDSLQKEIPTIGHLSPNANNNYSRSFDGDYRVSLYMFGITNNIPIYIKMTVEEEGDVYFNSTSQHAVCASSSINLEMENTIHLAPDDSLDLYKWPFAEWIQYNYEMVWTGTDELYMAEGNKCNVNRYNDMTLDDEHYFIDDYEGTFSWGSNEAFALAKDYDINDKYVRFYPEGEGDLIIHRLPTRINTFAMIDSTVFATIDQENRIIKCLLPKGSVRDVAIQDAKIIFEPKNQTYSYNADYSVITIDDGINSQYTLDISVVPNTANTDATLQEITVDGTPIAGFSPADTAYTSDCLAVPIIDAKTTDPNATYVVKQATDYDRVATITVTAEDVYVTKTYTVEVNLPLHSDATLSALKANDVTIAGFSPNILRYEYNVKSADNIPQIAGTPNDYRFKSCETTRTASKTILPDSSQVTCVAEDGSSLVYTVVFDTYVSTDATLSSLKVNGVAVEPLDPNMPASVTVGALPPVIEAIPTHPKAKSEVGEGVALGFFTQYPITVTAEDGETKLTYSVWCMVDADADASLSAIYLDGAPIEDFAANQLNYVLERSEKPGTISWDLNDSRASAESNKNTKDNLTNYLINVTAANGTATLTYSVTVVVKTLSNDATLSYISFDGGLTPIEGFAPDKYQYSYTVTEVPADELIDAETNVPTAKINKAWNDSKTQLVFTVTAEDATTLTYTIDFLIDTYEPSHDATLSMIGVVGGMSITNPEPGIDLELMAVSSEYDIEWTATDPMTIVDTTWLDDHTVMFMTIAEDAMTVLNYTVVVNIQQSLNNDATLKSLTIDGQTFTSFVEGGQPNNFTVTSVDGLIYETNDPSATATTSWAGNNLTIDVTAQDGVTTARYLFIFTIDAPSNDATLKSVTVDGQTFTSFVEGGQPNTFTVTTTEGLTYQTNDPNATATTSWTGNNLTIDITAQDGVTTARYLFIFNIKTLNNDATLAYIQVFDDIITDFVPYIPNNITLTSVPTESDVIVVTTDPNATINYTWSENSLTLDVTAEDGVTTLRYVFIAQIPELSDDNSLSDLALNGVTIAGFSPLTYKYEVSVTELPVVSATANDAKATLSVTQPTTDNTISTIIVTAENGSTQTYTVQFTIITKVDASLIPLEVVFANGFKGFINGDSRTIDVYYLSTEELPIGIKSWKPQEGCVINSLELTSYNTLKVTSGDGEAVYSISYYPVAYASLRNDITYYFDGTEDYIKTAYYYTDSRGWRISKDIEEEENRRISRGKDRMYFFIPGCAAIRLNTTTISRSVRISLNGVDITEKQEYYDNVEGAFYTGSQGEITYINGLTKRKPMMLEIENYGSTGDAAFNAITLLSEEYTGWENNLLATLSFVNGVVINPNGLQLSVYNITGQLVAESSADIDLNSQPSAVYIIRCEDQIIKIIK